MADRPRITERPWGRYREYARNEPCTVWLIEMKPGEAGSLQSHRDFDELWIMLTDGGEVQVVDEVRQESERLSRLIENVLDFSQKKVA